MATTRNNGRSSRKRAQATGDEDTGVMDIDSNRLLTELEQGATTAEEVVIAAAKQSRAESVRTMLTLKRVQCHLLMQYTRLMKKAAKTLQEDGCWQVCKLHYEEARRAGVAEELEHLAFQYAAEFADRRMAKLTMKFKGKE